MDRTLTNPSKTCMPCILLAREFLRSDLKYSSIRKSPGNNTGGRHSLNNFLFSLRFTWHALLRTAIRLQSWSVLASVQESPQPHSKRLSAITPVLQVLLALPYSGVISACQTVFEKLKYYVGTLESSYLKKNTVHHQNRKNMQLQMAFSSLIYDCAVINITYFDHFASCHLKLSAEFHLSLGEMLKPWTVWLKSLGTLQVVSSHRARDEVNKHLQSGHARLPTAELDTGHHSIIVIITGEATVLGRR